MYCPWDYEFLSSFFLIKNLQDFVFCFFLTSQTQVKKMEASSLSTRLVPGALLARCTSNVFCLLGI